MISSEEFVQETQQLLEENLGYYDKQTSELPDETQVETFFRMNPEQQRMTLLHMVSEGTALMTIIDRLTSIDVEMAMLIEGHSLKSLGRSFFQQVICELRAQQHYQQALLEVFNAVVADVERHADGTLCIESLAPFTVSDIAQMIIDSFRAQEPVDTTVDL